MLESISARLNGQVFRSAILGRYAAAHAWKDSLGIASFGCYGLYRNKSVPFFSLRDRFVALADEAKASHSKSARARGR